MVGLEKDNGKDVSGRFVENVKTKKVAIASHIYNSKKSGIVVVCFLEDDRKTIWLAKNCKFIRKPKGWKGKTKVKIKKTSDRLKDAENKRDIIKKLFLVEGLSRKEIRKKTGYSKTVVQRAFEHLGLNIIQHKDVVNINKEDKYVDPDTIWHGRYCRNPNCKTKDRKIIGMNHWYCKSCHLIMHQAVSMYEYGAYEYEGQYFEGIASIR